MRLRLRPKTVTQLQIVTGKLSPGIGWNGTLGDSAPNVPARTTASPWAMELFQNWDTQTGDVTVGFDSGAGGLFGNATGVSKVTFFSHGNSLDVTSEKWVTEVGPNGTSFSSYGWFVDLNIVSSLARATALGVAKPQFSLWAVAYPRDTTMQPRMMGPYTFNPRPTRFDGSINMLSVGVTPVANVSVNSFSAAMAYKRTAGIERLNIICTQQGAVRMDPASIADQIDSIVTSGVYGVTITAAKTADVVGSVAAGTSLWNVTSVTNGSITAGNTACIPGLLPNIIVAPFGTNGSTGTGGVGTYVLQAFGPDDVYVPPVVDIPVGTVCKTTVTVTLGDGTFVNFVPHVDGIRFEGAGIKIDFSQIGYGIAGAMGFPSTVLGTSNPSQCYGAWTFAGCDTFTGVLSNAGGVTRTGSGAHGLIQGTRQGSSIFPGLTIAKTANIDNIVPSGSADSQRPWTTSILGHYHHDVGYGLESFRLLKHTTFAGLAATATHNPGCIHAVTILQNQPGQVPRVNLRTWVDQFLITPPSGLNAKIRTTAVNGVAGNMIFTKDVGGIATDVATVPYALADTFPSLQTKLTTGAIGAALSDWVFGSIRDTTTGRSASYMNVNNGNVPSHGIPSTTVPDAGLMLSSILDVHADTMGFFGSTPIGHGNRAVRFMVAVQSIMCSPMLSNGSGSYLFDTGIRNCIFGDITPTADIVGLSIGHVCNHLVWVDNTTQTGSGGISLTYGGYDQYCLMARNTFGNINWSTGTNLFTATFDGSTMMTVTATSAAGQNSLPDPLHGFAGVYPGSVLANGATILSQNGQTQNANGDTIPYSTGTYILDTTLDSSRNGLQSVVSNKSFVLLNNVNRFGAVPTNAKGTDNRSLGVLTTSAGAQDTDMYQDPVHSNFAPKAVLLQTDGTYAGALNLDGSWKLTP